MRTLALWLSIGCAAATEVPTAATPPDGFWAHWGDGRAELDGYRLVQPRYGELRQGEVVLVFVTETFTDGQRVKSDGGHDDEFPVMKLNEARDFRTGIYDYNAMTSAFAALDGRHPLGTPTKVSFSMQEWCGQAWGQLHAEGDTLRSHWHSYFDGEGDGEATLRTPPGGVTEDLAPMLVRGLLGPWVELGETRQVPWLPRLMHARLQHTPLEWTTATVTREAHGDVEHWTIATDARTLTYRVQAGAPHHILGWEASDGERAELTGTLRTAYWTQHREGDETLRARLGLTD